MYQLLPSFVLGFHGCDRDVGEAVLAGQHLAYSTNDYDWLGEGVYFWENSPHRALSYAQMLQQRTKRTKGRIKSPFVVGAILDLGLCLNLTDEDALQQLKQAHRILASTVATLDDLPKNKPGHEGDVDDLKRHLDCAVFQTLHAAREEIGLPVYQSVRSPFWEGGKLYPGASFHEKTHIQICIRDLLCVKGYFRPRDSDGSLFQS